VTIRIVYQPGVSRPGSAPAGVGGPRSPLRAVNTLPVIRQAGKDEQGVRQAVEIGQDTGGYRLLRGVDVLDPSLRTSAYGASHVGDGGRTAAPREYEGRQWWQLGAHLIDPRLKLSCIPACRILCHAALRICKSAPDGQQRRLGGVEVPLRTRVRELCDKQPESRSKLVHSPVRLYPRVALPHPSPREERRLTPVSHLRIYLHRVMIHRPFRRDRSDAVKPPQQPYPPAVRSFIRRIPGLCKGKKRVTVGLREDGPTVTMRMEGLEYARFRCKLHPFPLSGGRATALSQQLVHERVHITYHLLQAQRTGKRARGRLRPVSDLLLREWVEGHELRTQKCWLTPLREPTDLGQPPQDLTVVEDVKTARERVERKPVPVSQLALQRPPQKLSHLLKDFLIVIPDVTEDRNGQAKNKKPEFASRHNGACQTVSHTDNRPLQRAHKLPPKAEHLVDEVLTAPVGPSTHRRRSNSSHDPPRHP